MGTMQCSFTAVSSSSVVSHSSVSYLLTVCQIYIDLGSVYLYSLQFCRGVRHFQLYLLLNTSM